ncbi:Hcp1 family type VI secretion system effector [Erwinia typographi]|uniref:Hcp1 family type VI secretion system effector n=1 Tax=Erwinia typographi TaxID=371042 RepID=A0A0A3YKB6_9GAMM|nr:type VI secretion system tube protein TssD [Erwinia typographi]KGT87242.1 Hcp1 family type VI secretion system effector [Erwinia typographi]
MSIPVYLWIFEEEGKLLKGSVDVSGREGSIELTGMQHDLFIPTDDATGAAIGTRRHEAYTFEKLTDCSSPLLYKALTTGKTLAKAVFKFYRINYNGQEEEYFVTTLENVKVCHVVTVMYDTKDPDFVKHGHIEHVGLCYEKIDWHYTDGNIKHTDSWNDRKTA